MRPNDVGAGAYCMTCKYILQNAHEYLKKKTAEADILEYLEITLTLDQKWWSSCIDNQNRNYGNPASKPKHNLKHYIYDNF